MANPAYPDLPIDAKDSKAAVRDGRQEDTAGDGTTAVRKLYPDRTDFNLHHPSLILDDVATLRAFYDANAVGPIDFTWPQDGLVYQVQFGVGALREEWDTPTRRHVYVRLVAA